MKIIEGKELGKWLRSSLRKPEINCLCIASPFLTKEGLKPVIDWLKRPGTEKKSVTLLTRLDMMAIAAKVLDIEALEELLNIDNHSVKLYSAEGLHAKVYLLNGEVVVGSGNATLAGTGGGNIELGIRIRETEAKKMFSKIQERFNAWLSEGQSIDRDILESWRVMYKKYYAGRLVVINPNRLQIFAGKEDVEYLKYMRKALKDINDIKATNKKRCDIQTALKKLENRWGGEKGSDTPENRLRFLEFLGLIHVENENVEITKQAEHLLVASKAKASEDMLELLIKKVPLMHIVNEWLKDNENWKNYKELSKANGYLSHYRKNERDNAVRWMIDLGAVEVRDEGTMSFRLKRNNKK
jgi:hypothetical protein